MTQPDKNFRCGLPLLAFTAALFLALGGFAGFYLKDHLAKTSTQQSPNPAPQSPTALIAGNMDGKKIPEAASAAKEALKQFLTADTVEKRLRYTLGADVMKPLMESYYQQSTAGPVTVDRIEFVRMDSNPQVGTGRQCIFSLESKAWEFSLPVMMEEEPDGFKVDWQTFVEFKDRQLEKFFTTHPKEPMRFHVGIIRIHYFDNEAPDLDRKDCFHVSSAPPNLFRGHVFLVKDSKLAQQLRTHLPWEQHMWVVVELEWKKLGSQQWVELKDVPQMHWYTVRADSKPAAPKQ